MLHAFTIGFERVLKICFLLLAALSGFPFYLVASLKIPAMIICGTESFPQHNMADLNSGITFIVLFSLEKPLW